MRNAINWFEIPVTDLDRATKFYEETLDIRLRREDTGPTPMAIFAAPDPAVAGALALSPRRRPSEDGTMVYINVNGQLDAVLARVPRAGGTILQDKMDLCGPGFIGIFRDTEGNVVGVHSEP